jgi:hypothetical protein
MKVNRRFEKIYWLHIQDRKVSQARNQREAGSKQSLFVRIACVLVLLLNRENGRDIFLWNVGKLSPDWTKLYPRRKILT